MSKVVCKVSWWKFSIYKPTPQKRKLHIVFADILDTNLDKQVSGNISKDKKYWHYYCESKILQIFC